MKERKWTCPGCGAGFRRIELWSELGAKGEYHWPVCDSPLEIFDGINLIAYRLTIQPVPRTLRDEASLDSPTL